MSDSRITEMRRKHQVLAEIPYEPTPLQHGYTDRVLRVDVTTATFDIRPVPQQMKDLWIGGKGYDLWLMFQEINKNTRWDSPENVISLSSGPLGGAASFPGSGKTLVTTVSPATGSIMDSNVGGYFGPYLKFAGFDAMVLAGKAEEDVIVVIDVPKGTLSIEKASMEAQDAHVICEQLTEMYADCEDDKRNIAVVAAGSASDHVWMGVLNFSFYDWRRKVARIKQAGRGGIGTVFRNKKIKALVIKNKFFTPSWTIAEPPFADEFKVSVPESKKTLTFDDIRAITKRWNGQAGHVADMLLEAQARQGFISREVIDGINEATRIPKSHLYHTVTFYPSLSLKPVEKQACCCGGCCDQRARVLESPEAVALKNIDAVDPENIHHAMDRGAYAGARKAITTMKPDKVTQTIIDSGLRGRGGSGFSTGLKWKITAEATAKQKKAPYVVCNAGESGPGACIDRTIIESDPHGVIEGMIIGGFAIGAQEGHIFIRHDFTAARDRLYKAIELARATGLLGKQILGSDFSFDIFIHLGLGSFVDGEASAVIESMSGRVGEPQAKMVHQSEKGFRETPTVINNVETWITIPAIIHNGIEWFASIGKASGTGHSAGASAGTKVFALSGAINNPGLLEVPLGTSLRHIIETVGGGMVAGKTIKAVHIGGPSGGFLPKEKLDTVMDFETLEEAGCIMGTGDIVVMDQTTCMLDTIASFTKYLASESCGKCTPCREGLQKMYAVLKGISNGKGKPDDLAFLDDLADTIKVTSLCQFGVTAANPVLTGIRYFRNDLMTHIETGKCPSNSAEVK